MAAPLRSSSCGVGVKNAAVHRDARLDIVLRWSSEEAALIHSAMTAWTRVCAIAAAPSSLRSMCSTSIATRYPGQFNFLMICTRAIQTSKNGSSLVVHNKNAQLGIPPQLLPLAFVLDKRQLLVNVLAELRHEVHQGRASVVDLVHDERATAE